MIGDNIVRGGQRHAFQQEEIIMDGMKNISKAEVLTLRDQVAISPVRSSAARWRRTST